MKVDLAHRVLPVLVRCNPHEQFRSCKSVPLLPGWISREIGLKCPRMRCREYSTVRMQCNPQRETLLKKRVSRCEPPSCCPRSRTPYTMGAPETPPPSVAVAQGGTNVGSAGNHGPYKCGGGGKRATNPPRFLAPRGQPPGSSCWHCNRRGAEIAAIPPVSVSPSRGRRPFAVRGRPVAPSWWPARAACLSALCLWQ